MKHTLFLIFILYATVSLGDKSNYTQVSISVFEKPMEIQKFLLALGKNDLKRENPMAGLRSYGLFGGQKCQESLLREIYTYTAVGVIVHRIKITWNERGQVISGHPGTDPGPWINLESFEYEIDFQPLEFQTKSGRCPEIK